MTSTTEQKISQQTITKSKTPLQVQPIKDAVNNCLKLTSKDAIVALGKQGGYLYQDQGGPIATPSTKEAGETYVDYENARTKYLVDEPQGTVGKLFYTTSPEYPWELFPYVDGSYAQTQYYGYYGINQLPALYKPYKDSIQEQIETFVQNNINTCIKWDAYPALEITSGQPNVTLYIANDTGQITTEESVYLTMNWPIMIREKNSNTTTAINEFGTALNIPLAKIYYNITKILSRDVQDITYEPKSEGNYVVTIIKQNQDSLVFVKFVGVRVDDKPYEFRFARHTRLPALHLIKELKTELNLPNKKTEKDTIQLAQGAVISISENKLNFANYKCTTNEQVPAPWDYDSINLITADPDSEQNNPNIKFKLDASAIATEQSSGDIKFTKVTKPEDNPIEVKLITQKIDTLNTKNKKEDWQTFYVRVYMCAPK